MKSRTFPPPPLWGRAGVGDIVASCRTIVPEISEPTRPTRNDGCGRGCAGARSQAITSAAKPPLAPISSISSASRRGWSSRWMVDSMRSSGQEMPSGRNGWNTRVSAWCGSGTTMCSAIPTEWLQQLQKRWDSEDLTPPRQPSPTMGGGGTEGQSGPTCRASDHA